MVNKADGVRELSVALVTNERSLTAVDMPVVSEASTLGELRRTFRAAVRLFTAVNSLMCFEFLGSDKAFVALPAAESFLADVDA